MCGWAFAIWGTALYWWAGLLYVAQVRPLTQGYGARSTAVRAAPPEAPP